MNIKKKFLILVLSVLWVFTALPEAFAHNFVITPDKFNPSVGDKVGIAATFTHEMGKGQYPVFGLERVDDFLTAFNGPAVAGVYDGPFVISADITTGPNHSASFTVKYNNTSDTIPNDSFKPYGSKLGRVLTGKEIPLNDSDYATFDLKESGTAVVLGEIKMALNIGIPIMGYYMPPGESFMYVKTFLNLTNDGMAANQFDANDEYLEIVFADEVPQGGIKLGDEVKFQALFKGQPLQNADVHSSYIGADVTYEGPGEGWVNDSYLEGKTDNDGYVSFTFDHAAGWLVGMEHEDAGEAYMGGVMFNVTSEENRSSGGGCSATGGSGLLAFLALGLDIKKRFAGKM